MKKISIANMQTTDFRYNEAIKTLRTNLQFSGSNVRTVLVTSSEAGEGKSTLSWDLACSIAETGKSVCFIDADIRKSTFAVRHQINQKVNGLSQLLSGQCELKDCLYETDVPNLSMIFAGPYSPSPTELFEDLSCGELFAQLKDMPYDYLIVDTPPLGVVVDAAILSRYADGYVLVAESGVTKKKLLKRVKEQIERTGIRLLGVVLNRVESGKNGYYKRYYGKGYYDSERE